MLYPNFITEKWGVKLIDVVIPNLWILKSHATKSFKSDSACCFSWSEERCVRGSITALLGHHMGSADPRGPSSSNPSSASLRNSASVPLHEELHKTPRDLYIHKNNSWRWLSQFQPNINIKENKNMIKVNFNRDSK